MPKNAQRPKPIVHLDTDRGALWKETRKTIRRLIELARENGATLVCVHIEDNDGTFKSRWTPRFEARARKRRAERDESFGEKLLLVGQHSGRRPMAKQPSNAAEALERRRMEFAVDEVAKQYWRWLMPGARIVWLSKAAKRMARRKKQRSGARPTRSAKGKSARK